MRQRVAVVAGLVLALGGGAAAAQDAAYVEYPLWAQRPTAEDLARLYPAGARARMALVRIDCAVDAGGRLSGCRVTQEMPQGQGFGAATVEAARLFRIQPLDRGGGRVGGRRLRLPVRWDAPWAGR